MNNAETQTATNEANATSAFLLRELTELTERISQTPTQKLSTTHTRESSHLTIAQAAGLTEGVSHTLAQKLSTIKRIKASTGHKKNIQ